MIDRDSPATPTASPTPSVHLVTFGCQMNKYDSELVLERFLQRGYRVSDTPDDASVVLFNTCSVRAHAEDRVYSRLGALRAAKERNPHLVLGVFGCMAQREGDDIVQNAPLVDLVCGTREFLRLPDLVDQVIESGGPLVAIDPEPRVEVGDRPRERRSVPHTYVAVMRGCDLNCTFCIVPTVRGRVRSRAPEDLEEEIRRLVDDGISSVTLLGQTVNSYGYDLGDRAFRLSHLLRRLDRIRGLERIHLVTGHPSYLTEDLIDALAELPSVSRFLPLPAQSGSDDVLRRMRRGYTTDLYRRRMDALRERVPDVELSSDWIVGFPGETDADFAASEAFLREQGFLQSFVFKYSPRPGTQATGWEDDVPEAVKKERNQRLLAVAEEVQRARYAPLAGRELEVYVEAQDARRVGRFQGRTRQGHVVRLDVPEATDPRELLGRVVAVRCSHVTSHAAYGERTAAAPSV